MTFLPILENPYSYLYLKKSQKRNRGKKIPVPYSEQDLLTGESTPMLNNFILAIVILQGTPDFMEHHMVLRTRL